MSVCTAVHDAIHAALRRALCALQCTMFSMYTVVRMYVAQMHCSASALRSDLQSAAQLHASVCSLLAERVVRVLQSAAYESTCPRQALRSRRFAPRHSRSARTRPRSLRSLGAPRPGAALSSTRFARSTLRTYWAYCAELCDSPRVRSG